MLDAQITQLSSDELDKFFETTPSGTPNADTLATGTEDKNVRVIGGNDDIPYFDDAEVAEEEGTETPEQLAAKAKAAEKAAADAKAIEEANKGKTPEELEAEKAAAEAKVKEAADAEANKVPVEQVNTILKNTVDYLIKAGKWVDWQGREDLEITEEMYAEIAAKQDEFRLNQQFNDLVDSTGAYGKAIISHIRNGGNPDVVLDLFKEQQALKQIDVTTEDGKRAVIEKFYKEVVGFTPSKVEKDIKRLITDNRIEEEYDEVKERYEKHYKDQLAKADEEVNAKNAVEAQRKAAFVTTIKSTLESDSTLSPQEKKLIESSMLDFKHDVGGGKKVNDFYIKFAEMQANPKEYIELVRFVMDPKNYKKAIETTADSKAAKNVFNFVKGNAAVGKTKGSTVEINENAGANKGYKGTDFSFVANKR